MINITWYNICVNTSVYVCVCVYIYIYIYIYTTASSSRVASVLWRYAMLRTVKYLMWCMKCHACNVMYVRANAYALVFYYTILCYTILHYDILYNTLVYYIMMNILMYTILYYTIVYYTLTYTILWYTILIYIYIYTHILMYSWRRGRLRADRSWAAALKAPRSPLMLPL